MKHAAVLSGCGILLLLVSGVGCASKSGAAAKSAEPAAAVPAAQAKGHWTTLPPETGSHIPRRVWVNEDGTIAATPGGPAVDTYDPSVMQEWQRRGSFHGRTGD
ncbi:MAG: hypothetical protein KJ072_17385 [Verrucomicrobia bacterium]|nr:hypothetical protein [Verrucomicrobiota bacterium]